MRHDGLFGHHQGGFVGGKHRGHTGKHARAQFVARRRRQHGTHRNRAAVGVQQRVDGLHPGLKTLPRQGVQLHTHTLPRRQATLVALGQAEIDRELGGVLQVDQIGAVLDVFAQVDVAQAQRAVKRRHDAHARQPRLRQSHLGLGHLQGGAAFVEHALRHKGLGHQFLVALQICAGDRQLGLGLAEFGLLQHVVQLHQELTLSNFGAVGEGNAGNAPADFGPQHHALARAQRAHSLRIVLQRHCSHRDDLHADRPTACPPAGRSRRTGATGALWACAAGGARRGLRLGSAGRGFLIPPGARAGQSNAANGDPGGE